MGFKLKFKNVQASTDGPSPFKINEALVAGAGTAAKGFTDLQGAFMSGAGGGGGVSDSSGGSSSSEAEKESEEKTCVEQGLEGQELEDCQTKEKENDNKKKTEEEENNSEEETDVNKPMSRADFKSNNLKGDEEGQFKNYGAYEASFDTPE